MAYIPTTKKISVYDIVTEKIIKLLGEGIIPWQKPSTQTPALNLVTKRPYEGINTMLLRYGYTSPYWLTFAQAKKMGGYVNSGEKGTPIVWWSMFKKDKKDVNGNTILTASGEAQQEVIPVLRYYTVFNTEQCTLPEGKVPETPVRDDLTAVGSVVEHYADCPEIQYGNFASGSYSDDLDQIKMPVVENFDSEENFHAGLFHELVHSTRHIKRLNRKERKESFKAANGFEDLVAEIGSAFLCYETGIETTIPNQTAYIAEWLTALNADKRMIVYASSSAQKAVEHIIKKNKAIEQTVEIASSSPEENAPQSIPETLQGDIYDIL